MLGTWAYFYTHMWIYILVGFSALLKCSLPVCSLWLLRWLPFAFVFVLVVGRSLAVISSFCWCCCYFFICLFFNCLCFHGSYVLMCFASFLIRCFNSNKWKIPAWTQRRFTFHLLGLTVILRHVNRRWCSYFQ